MRPAQGAKLLPSLVAAFAEKVGAWGQEVREDKAYLRVSVYTNLLRIEFCYHKKEKILCPVSTLFCRVYLQKNQADFCHLPELLEALPGGAEDYRCWYFPYIENEERLTACFAALSNGLTHYLPAITELANDPERSERFCCRQWGECARILGWKESDFVDDPVIAAKQRTQLRDIYEQTILIPRFTQLVAYQRFLAGDRARAVAGYQKIAPDKCTNYETRLLAFLESPASVGYDPIPEECFTVPLVKPYKGSGREFGWGVVYGLLCWAAFSLLLCALMAGVEVILGRGAVYSASAPWYFGGILGGFPAIFGAIALRRRLAKWLRGKRVQEVLDFEDLLNSPAVDRFATAVFALALALALFGGVVLPCISIRFYKDHLISPVEENPFVQETYRYEDIQTVYYIEGRYNDFGDFIDRPSYVLEFADGTQMDLDGYTEPDKTEEHILPILGVTPDEVVHLSSDKEL